MFIAGLFTISKIGKPICPSMDEWLKKHLEISPVLQMHDHSLQIWGRQQYIRDKTLTAYLLGISRQVGVLCLVLLHNFPPQIPVFPVTV